MEKIIHQIWVGPLDMPLEERYFTRDVKLKNSSWEHILWTDKNLPKLPDNIKKVYDVFGEDKIYAFQADVLRLFLVKEYGGLYLDIDFMPLNNFDDFQDLPDVFCDWDGLILNGVFGANKNNEGLVKACDAIDVTNTWYGPSWFTKVMSPYITNKISLDNFETKYAKHNALSSWL